MDENTILLEDKEYNQINQLYDECLDYLKTIKQNEEPKKSKKSEDITKDKFEIIDKEFDDRNEPIYAKINSRKQSNNIEVNGHHIPEEVRDEELIKDDETSQDRNEINNIENIMMKDFPKSEDNDEESDTGIIIFNANRDTNKQDKNNERDDDNEPKIDFKIENEFVSNESINLSEPKSDRLRRLSQQLPKIIITQSNTSLNGIKEKEKEVLIDKYDGLRKINEKRQRVINIERNLPHLRKGAFPDFPKRLVSKSGIENVALISNVPFEKIRLLNDTFHTLINLRWRWIVIGTVVVHFLIWIIFAVFWYITALAHYDFEPDPPKRSCVTGGKDFVTIFLASVEAQTTIGFGDRAIDEECPESIFLFIMQLILGTGLSGVLTCVVYAKLTRPEKLSRDGVGFSKKAVSIVCYTLAQRHYHIDTITRAWDLNYDHIINSEFSAHFINTYRTKEGELIRYYARSLPLQQRQFLIWPVILVHQIDEASPLYRYTPEVLMNTSFEITVSLKGASASMGTFTQSQSSYMPKEVVWGYKFPPVVKYDSRKQKYVIDQKKLNAIEPIDTPLCSAYELDRSTKKEEPMQCPGTPNSFSERISSFTLERSSSFRKKDTKN